MDDKQRYMYIDAPLHEVEPHFSRSYPQCEDDGFTWEEVKEEIIKDLKGQIDWWESQTEESYFG